MTASQRMASKASRPIRGPVSRTTPASPLDGLAWVVSTNTVSWAGGGSSVTQSSARAIAFRHEESPLLPSGRRGRSSAFSEIVLLTRAPVAPSIPNQPFHHDSSREGCMTRNWSEAVRYSSSALIRTRLAASRRTPATSRCSRSPTSSEIRDRASRRSKVISPPANASRRSGRSTVLRMVRTRDFAVSGWRSNRAVVHSDKDRQPSAVATWHLSRSSSTSI